MDAVTMQVDASVAHAVLKVCQMNKWDLDTVIGIFYVEGRLVIRMRVLVNNHLPMSRRAYFTYDVQPTGEIDGELLFRSSVHEE